MIGYAGLGARDEFLTDGANARLQVIESFIEPGGGTGPDAYVHESDEECLLVLDGCLELWVGDEHYQLEAGDADPLLQSHRSPQPESRARAWRGSSSSSPRPRSSASAGRC